MHMVAKWEATRASRRTLVHTSKTYGVHVVRVKQNNVWMVNDSKPWCQAPAIVRHKNIMFTRLSWKLLSNRSYKHDVFFCASWRIRLLRKEENAWNEKHRRTHAICICLHASLCMQIENRHTSKHGQWKKTTTHKHACTCVWCHIHRNPRDTRLGRT
jgi:hypothetical protein